MRPSRSVLGLVVLTTIGCATGSPPTGNAPLEPRGETTGARPGSASWTPPACPTTRPPATDPYELSQLPVFSKVLFYVRENYIDPQRFVARRALLGALDFVQDETPEVFYELGPERPARSITLHVRDQVCQISIENVDAPWSLRSALQWIMRFIQPNLRPVPKDAAGPRLLAIERAATNGMLYTLDPHSILLDPETYGSMRSQPHSPSAGVGLTIAFDQQDLPVVRAALPDSPAERAGLVSGDHIVDINGESTVHMNLDEIVKRLRGADGSILTLVVERARAKTPKTVSLARTAIPFSSMTVTPRVLTVSPASGVRPAKIGYLRLERFGPDAARRVGDALSLLQRENVRGIVFDLRDNSGGLYEQAGKVIDAFAKKGVMVSMIGNPRGPTASREETADDDGDEPLVPVAVLVNHDSAAASEIVAAALRNLVGAVLIGERTAGSGSVQVLYEIDTLGDGFDRPKLGLKLTTAQWVTADGVSFQGVGLLPDVALSPSQLPTPGALKAGTAMTEPLAGKRRTDDSHELPHSGTAPISPPALATTYLVDGDEDVTRQQDEATLAVARDMLATCEGTGRTALLAAATPILAAYSAKRDATIASALASAGFDWSVARSADPEGRAELVLSSGNGDQAAKAGRALELRGTVTNTGPGPLHRVHVTLAGATDLLDRRQMLFGRIDPGKSATVTLAIPVSPGTLEQADVVRGRLGALSYVRAKTADTVVRIGGQPRPRFTASYELNAGPPLKGSISGRVVVKVKNVGSGAAPDVRTRLGAPPSGSDMSITAGHFRLGALAPGREGTSTFAYSFPLGEERTPHSLDLAVADVVFGESIMAKVAVDELGRSATPHTITPPALMVSAPALVDDVSVRVTGSADDGDGVADVWIRVFGASGAPAVRKVFAITGAGAPPHQPIEAIVPLWPGANLIEVVARDAHGARTTAKVAVLRTLPGPPLSTEPGMR